MLDCSITTSVFKGLQREFFIPCLLSSPAAWRDDTHRPTGALRKYIYLTNCLQILRYLPCTYWTLRNNIITLITWGLVDSSISKVFDFQSQGAKFDLQKPYKKSCVCWCALMTPSAGLWGHRKDHLDLCLDSHVYLESYKAVRRLCLKKWVECWHLKNHTGDCPLGACSCAHLCTFCLPQTQAWAHICPHTYTKILVAHLMRNYQSTRIMGIFGFLGHENARHEWWEDSCITKASTTAWEKNPRSLEHGVLWKTCRQIEMSEPPTGSTATALTQSCWGLSSLLHQLPNIHPGSHFCQPSSGD